MSPTGETKLLALLERIAVALESGAAKANTPSGGGWRAVKLPKWPKYDAEKPLGELSDKSLAYWVSTFVPKPWERKSDGKQMPPSAADLALRAALDAAGKELGLPLPAAETPTEATEPAKSSAATASAPVDDEDVPF